MRELTKTESHAVAGGLALNLGQLIVGRNFKLGLTSSGTGLLGSLLGAQTVGLSGDYLVCLDGASLNTDGAAAPVAATCNGSLVN